MASQHLAQPRSVGELEHIEAHQCSAVGQAVEFDVLLRLLGAQLCEMALELRLGPYARLTAEVAWQKEVTRGDHPLLDLVHRRGGIELERRLHHETASGMGGGELLDDYGRALALRRPVESERLRVRGETRSHLAPIDSGEVLPARDEALDLSMNEVDLAVDVVVGQPCDDGDLRKRHAIDERLQDEPVLVAALVPAGGSAHREGLSAELALVAGIARRGRAEAAVELRMLVQGQPVGHAADGPAARRVGSTL